MPTRSRRSALLLLGTVFLLGSLGSVSTPADAGVERWTSFGPRDAPILSFAVDPAAWVRDSDGMARTDYGRVHLSHWNLNDGTLEGLRCLDVPALSVQYHPEAAPGPHDSRYLFAEFRALMDRAA